MTWTTILAIQSVGNGNVETMTFFLFLEVEDDYLSISNGNPNLLGVIYRVPYWA